MRIAEVISNVLVKNGDIDLEERNICKYGIEVILTWGIKFLVIILLSLCVGNKNTLKINFCQNYWFNGAFILTFGVFGDMILV